MGLSNRSFRTFTPDGITTEEREPQIFLPISRDIRELNQKTKNKEEGGGR